MFVGFDFKMKNLNRKRHITVYLPDDYYQNNCCSNVVSSVFLSCTLKAVDPNK